MSETRTLQQAYQTAVRPPRDPERLAQALNDWYQRWPTHNFLHPCVIDGKAALVCRADLSVSAADAYRELLAIAEAHGVYLKEDRRSLDFPPAHGNRRREVGLVLTFCIGLLGWSRAVCADDLLAPPPSPAAQLVAPPAGAMQAIASRDEANHTLIKLRRTQPPSAADIANAYQQVANPQPAPADAAAAILDFLKTAYRPELGEPANVAADFESIAAYYAHYPAVAALIRDLDQQKVLLKYRKNTWQAQAWGNQYRVDSVTIYFDTRLGAQLLAEPGCDANPACGVSPADALLHELLHAKLMLLDSGHFIAGGGMAQNLYPFEHEREVIAEENRLYRSMNQEDGLARPLRHRHSGQLAEVSCPACAPHQQLAAAP
ncbi:hypothetical protein [Methylomonas sp. CM2]|uniref:hypothetical protein n=1 Tax=Methylomonas sp. CM2 TaxID=3417647 RepID=UPI003CF91ABC